MANPTEVYSVKFDVTGALEALGKLETKLSSADKHARELLKGDKGTSDIDEALKRTSNRALALRQQFERSQNAIANAMNKSGRETRKQTVDTKKLTDAGRNLDAMMRKFSRNASAGQKKVTRAIEGTKRAIDKTDTSFKKILRSSAAAARGIRRVGTSSAIATQSLTGLIAKTSAFISVVAGLRDVVSQYGEFDQAATSAVAKFSKFEPALRPGTEGFKKFKEEIRAATAGTEHSAAGAARAVDFWAKAGKSSEESKAVLKATLDFASANQDASGSMLDVARAGDILSDALGQFKLNSEDTTQLMANTARVSDVMSAAANSANMSAEELFEAFKGAGPTLNLVGEDIEMTSALLAAMANAGIKGAAAGTQLKMSVANLTAMTGPQEAAMKKLEVTVKDADGNFRGLTTVIRDLNEATKDMGTADRAQVFAKAVGRRALPSFINLLAEGKVNLDAMAASLRKSGGETGRLAAMMRQSGQAQLDMFKNKLRDVGFEVIEKTGIIAHLTEAVRNIDWPTVYKTIEQKVIPAFKTVGKTLVNVVIPAFRNAWKTVSAVLTPALEMVGVVLKKLNEKGEVGAKILGGLIAAWVAWRQAMVAVKIIGMVDWLAKATLGMGQMTTATTAGTAAMGTAGKAAGGLKRALGAIGILLATWELAQIIQTQLIDPLYEARIAAKNVQDEIDAGKAAQKQGAGNKRSSKYWEEQMAHVDEQLLKDRKRIDEIARMGDVGRTLYGGEAVEINKRISENEAYRKNIENSYAYMRQKENIAKYGDTGEDVGPQSDESNVVVHGGRIVEQDEDWGRPYGVSQLEQEPRYAEKGGTKIEDVDPLMGYTGISSQPVPPAEKPVPIPAPPEIPPPVVAPGTPVVVNPPAETGVASALKEQSELAKIKAAGDSDYQKKSLELMKTSETKNVTQNIEVGPTTVNIETKASSPSDVGRAVRKEMDKRDRQLRNDLVLGARTIAPAEI